MLVREVPCEIRPPLLSIWYALPHSIMFAEAQYPPGFDMPSEARARKHLDTLWRVRQGGKVEDMDVSEMKKFFDANFYENDVWEEVELASRVKIVTPEGTLVLLPHEYNIVSDIDQYLAMVDGHHVTLEELGGIKAAKKLKEMVHYCQSRGISRLEAMKMCAGQVKRQNVYYLKMHEAYAEYFGLVDTQKYSFTEAA